MARGDETQNETAQTDAQLEQAGESTGIDPKGKGGKGFGYGASDDEKDEEKATGGTDFGYGAKPKK